MKTSLALILNIKLTFSMSRKQNKSLDNLYRDSVDSPFLRIPLKSQSKRMLYNFFRSTKKYSLKAASSAADV